MGRGLLVTQLLEQLRRMPTDAPTIVAPADVDAQYVDSLREACPGVNIVTSASALSRALASAEPSDLLLFVDPRCLPVNVAQLGAMVAEAAEHQQIARHLVGYAADLAGTRESVIVDADGHVRSVHRYFKPATWPFLAGVAASVVPVSSGILPLAQMPASLLELRQVLVSLGVPSRDVVMQSGAFDLSCEQGMLAAVEHSVVQTCLGDAEGDRTNIAFVGDGHQIDPSARLIGPIIVQPGVRIGPRATVVGPALLGAGTQVDADAILAHVSLGAGARVPEGVVLRDRVCGVDGAPVSAEAGASETAPTFAARLTRQAFDTTGPMLSSTMHARPMRIYPYVKRGADATLAALALIVLSPLLALIAILVWLDSRGPVFFKHEREGVDGRMFGCVKFRTMRVGANELQRKLKEQSPIDGPHFKIASDPRITTFGRLLRASNVDELPQLFNVLLGDMSLVGPRPSPFRENQVCVPWRNGRLSVRPGITGLWQVCRHDRQDGDFHQWIEYDLLYVQHFGLLLDLKILMATVVTLGGKLAVPTGWLVDVSPTDGLQPGLTVAPPPGSGGRRLPRTEQPARSTR